MAKFLFMHEVKKSTLVRAGLDSDIDLAFTDGVSPYVVKTSSDEDYEALVNGTKTLTISNDELSFGTTDLPINEDRECVESEFRGEVQHRIDCLENRIENMPTGHSKLDRAKEIVAFLKAIDLDAISYPTTTINKYLNDNNKYVNYLFI